MKLRKTYWVKQENRRKGYWYVQCPNTDLPRGNTTKLISQCKKCPDYFGMIVDEDVGRYVKCDYSVPKKMLESRVITMEDKPFYINHKLMHSLVYFNIHPKDFETKGLSGVKKEVKSIYRSLLKTFHPDTTKLPLGRAKNELRRLRSHYNRINKLRISPNEDFIQ